jgi:hypothetical protein
LSAIEKGISGNEIEREDFCRYSRFFTVEAGKRKRPDFGFEWVNLSEKDRTAVRQAIGLDKEEPIERLFTFRRDKDIFDVYVGDEKAHSTLTTEQTLALTEALPKVFHIDAKVALPDSVAIGRLSNVSGSTSASRIEQIGRKSRFDLLKGLAGMQSGWFSSAQTVQQSAPQLISAFSPFFSSIAQAGPLEEKAFGLARDLLLKEGRRTSADSSGVRNSLAFSD